MIGHREDVTCPACPNPATAFTLKDVGMVTRIVGDYRTDHAVTFTAGRPLWEPIMLEHLRLTDDERHQQLYTECITFLGMRGQTAEENARAEIKALTDHARNSIKRALQPKTDTWPAPVIGTQPGLANLKAKLDDAMRESAQPVRPVTLPGPCRCQP